MAPALALRLLTLALFSFMNDQGIYARDLKVELQDQKQVDSNGATPVPSDAPYIANYGQTTQPNYAASYTTQPYSTEYKANSGPSNFEPNQPYIASYQKHSGPSNFEPNQPYIASYQTHYSTAYKAHSGPRTHEPNQPYIAAYQSTALDLDQHILDAKNAPTNSGPNNFEPNQPYISSYRTHSGPPVTHEANQPYSTAYKAHSGPRTHEPNQPYIAAYQSTALDLDQHILDAKNAPTNSGPNNFEPNQPYISSYRTHSGPPVTHEANQPYSTAYKAHSGPRTHEPNQRYIAAYQSTALDMDQHVLDAKNAPKGDGRPKHDTKVSTQGYEETYQKKSKNVDHTDAFKTGFFALDDLYAGNVMTLQFPVQEISHFLSRKEANSIPFSLSQLPSVLQLFSIPEDSPKAKSMRGTLEQCEAEPITGEKKTCANSLEAMLEFVDSVIGSNTKYDLLTTSHPTPTGSPLQNYTILEVSQDIDAPKWVACHPFPYSYAVYYCHFISTGTKVFKVSLGGENGDRVEALGVCHLDTSDWSPSHVIFKQLGIEAGMAPVCHFFPVKHLMWITQP